VGAAWTSTRW